MNSEELKKNFSLLMPSEINGFKRPKEPIANDNDFFLEVPQLIQKDPVLYSTMNLILGVLVSNDKLLKQWHDTLQNVVNAQDWRVVTDSLKGYMTPELKKKLDGIATGANNYVHPANHPATMITQDATHRFVTDTEKTTWNGKASTAVVSTTANGLAPKRDGNASHFLAGDGTWKTVSSVANATTASKLGTSTVGSATKPVYINNGVASAVSVDLSTLAPKESPGLTGTPTAPTANVDTNDTQIATCGFVRNAIAKYAPMLDTMKKIYPVGSIYISTVSTNPSELFGFGTWEAMPAGRVLLAQGKVETENYTHNFVAGETGGEFVHQLTVGEMPTHSHEATTNTTGNHHHGTVWTDGTYSVWGLYNSSTNHRGMGAGNDNDNALPNTSTDGNHSHTVTINNAGSNTAHNNIQPYYSCYMWHRTA